MSMNQDELLKSVKQVVLQFDVDAQVMLYGSRARGDYANDSDWDLLILLSRPVNLAQEMQLRRVLYHLELETGEILSPIFDTSVSWNSERNQFSPFYKNVTQEKIMVC